MKKQGWLFLIFIIFLLCPPCRFSHAAAAQNAVYVVRMNDKAMIEKDGRIHCGLSGKHPKRQQTVAVSVQSL